MDYIKLTQEVLSVGEASSQATHSSCGAISLFVGTTRDTFQVCVLFVYHQTYYSQVRQPQPSHLFILYDTVTEQQDVLCWYVYCFQGRDVVRLEYESYAEMAEKEMRNLCKIAREKWPVKHIVIYHR